MTVPGSSARMPASTLAAPSRMAVWPSWPQACITPTFSPRYSAVAVDLNGRSTCSVTGNASMSARSATVGPGLPPLQDADHAGVRDARANLEAQLAQLFGHDLRRAELAVAEFGVLVEVAAPRDHLRHRGVGGGSEALRR